MDEYERLKAQKDAILKRQEDAKDKRINALEAMLHKYRYDIQWGKAYSWLQHGAPTEDEGIAMAKQIVHLNVLTDDLLNSR